MSLPESETETASARTDTVPERQRGRTNQELELQLELLAEENRRLRTRLWSVRRNQYRRTAAGLAAIGLIALGGAVFFVGYRTILLSIAATGLFTAVLTVYLTPEQFIAAATSEAVYSALAANQLRLVDELDLQDTRVYVPVTDTASFETTAEHVRLFIPKWPEYEIPEPEELRTVLTVTSNEKARGLSLRPTGDPLLREHVTSSSSRPPESAAEIGRQLADALVEQFELTGYAECHADVSERRLTISTTDSAFGDVTRFDHPIASFVASGLASAISKPVVCHVREDDEPGQYVVVCRWLDSEDETN